MFSLYFGLFLAVGTIYFNIRVFMLGIKKINPNDDDKLRNKTRLPATIFEISFILWGGWYIFFMMLILALPTVIMTWKKIEGHKFIMFTIAPIIRCFIVIYGIYDIIIIN